MTEKPALPPTLDWLKFHLTDLYTARSEEDFNRTFDNFISKHIHSITFNGNAISREEYKQIILREKPASTETSANLNFGDTVEAESTGSGAEKDTVGLSFTARFTFDEPLSENNTVSTVIVEVENDPSIPIPHPIGTKGGAFDTRRVFKLTQVLSVRVLPIG